MVVESGVCSWSRETGDGSVMSQFLLPTLLEYIIKYGGPNFKLWLNYINNLLFLFVPLTLIFFSIRSLKYVLSVKLIESVNFSNV